MEIKQADLEGSTDYALGFEELCALLDAKDIDVSSCLDYELNNASFFGRIFARTGGLSEAIKHVKEQYNLNTDFRPVSCDGIIECEKALKMAKAKKLDGNFIEGMVCMGGCIGGPLSLHHGPKDKREVDKYGQLAIEKGVKDSLRVFDINKLDLKRNLNK